MLPFALYAPIPIPPTPEAEVKDIAEQIGERVAREGARGALEDLAGESAEQSTEQQKVEALFNRVSEVNHQLGDELAHEVKIEDGTTTLLFKKLAWEQIGDSRIVNGFGVNSQIGPIRIDPRFRQDYNPPTNEGRAVKLPQTQIVEGKLPFWHFERITSSNDRKSWKEAFEQSRDSVLRNPEIIQKVREQRSQILDSALEVVSKPIDIDAPPPPVAPAGPGK